MQRIYLQINYFRFRTSVPAFHGRQTRQVCNTRSLQSDREIYQSPACIYNRNASRLTCSPGVRWGLGRRRCRSASGRPKIIFSIEGSSFESSSFVYKHAHKLRGIHRSWDRCRHCRCQNSSVLMQNSSFLIQKPSFECKPAGVAGRWAVTPGGVHRTSATTCRILGAYHFTSSTCTTSTVHGPPVAAGAAAARWDAPAAAQIARCAGCITSKLCKVHHF